MDRSRQYGLANRETAVERRIPAGSLQSRSSKGGGTGFNIVPSYRPGEATIDLMRRRSEAPNGIMDYIFAKLLLHNKEMGFERFTLGMAPMDGFHHGEQASPEERAIHAFFQHLNFLFSFKGLLTYKAKFATSWELW